MRQFSYLFRMDPDEHELLVSLSSRFQNRRETLSCVLKALEREVREREAGTQASREAIFKRLEAVEQQLFQLTRTPGKSRRSATGYR